MKQRSEGAAWGNWLVSKTSGFLDAKLNRRSFIARTTLLGSAIAATGCAVVTQPGSPYVSITSCPGGSLCTDGYTEFCCVINEGVNTCPAGTFPAGWWRADGSVYCNGAPRYYVDCNQFCCGPGVGGGFCAGCSPCRCAVDCFSTRKVFCNYFRYGQCNQQIGSLGPIACRMVLCVPPYAAGLPCSSSSAVDEATANHNADCAKYTPPPPLATVLPSSAAAVAAGSTLYVAGRGIDGAPGYQTFNGTTWSGFTSLGGLTDAGVAAVAHADNSVSVFVRGDDFQAYEATVPNGFVGLGGGLDSDPTAIVDQNGTTILFTRGSDGALWYNTGTPGAWAGLGGLLSSNATPVLDHSGTVWVYVRGSDNAGWVLTRSSGGAWGGFGSIGGQLASNLAGVCDGAGKVWVFARGTDNNMYTNTPGGSWAGLLGLSVSGDPTAAVDAGGTAWVFARGSDNNVWSLPTSTSTWTSAPPLSVGGDPAPVLFGGTLWLFAIASGSGVLNATTWNGSAWTPWQDLGTVLAPVHA